MNNDQKKRFAIKARARSFRYAFRGLMLVFLHQHNFRIHVTAALAAILLGIIFKISSTEWMFIIAAIGLVFTAETFNTAIEEMTDLVSPQQNNKAGNIKDIAAGAVLLAAFTALAIGLVIFIPKLFS